MMSSQPDARSAASDITGKIRRGSFVYRMLRERASADQAAVRAYLRREGISHRAYHVVNAVYAQLTEAQALAVTRLPRVERILPNPWTRAELGFPVVETARARQTVEWGVDRIGAPFLWSLGFRGEGAVVGGQDTGYDYLHPAIVNQYRGTGTIDTIHDYNWHDAIRTISPLHTTDTNPCGLDVPVPCDDNNHGTHTMGTMVGDDGSGNQIGVAPAARWIACRNMERGWGSPASYIECFEWFLAPTRVDGTDPNPDRAPHVIANSWSCPEVEGCNPDNFVLMETAINNLRAAGVVVVTSAGNSGGQGCGSVSTPPSIFGASFAVGATDSRDTIASFSSRGPVTIDSSGRLKPQVVAPGVSVRSSIRDGRYASFSGTSMSGPHVAGAVALLISAYPALAGNVDGIERILTESAKPLFSSQDCGDFPGREHPNAVYGYGRIDLEAAYQLAGTLVSTEDPGESPEIMVYPNPARESVWLQFPPSTQPQRVELFTTNGRLVLRPAFLSNGSSRVQLSLRDLPTGIYWLRVEMNGRPIVKRIIKQ